MQFSVPSIIVDIVAYVEAGTLHARLVSVENAIGRENLRLGLIKLLKWLTAQHDGDVSLHLGLTPGMPWLAHLSAVVEQVPALEEVFEMRDGSLRFRRALPKEVEVFVVSYVADNYRPPFMS